MLNEFGALGEIKTWRGRPNFLEKACLSPTQPTQIPTYHVFKELTASNLHSTAAPDFVAGRSAVGISAETSVILTGEDRTSISKLHAISWDTP
jgi:hypothetical protein